MIPKLYQGKMDSAYKQWVGGNINMLEVDRRKDPDNAFVFIQGIMVYELVFEDGSKWNCQTGWDRKGML